MAKLESPQTRLFELAEEPLEAAAFEPEHVGLATRLADSVRLGTMSWNYSGWRGVVYGATAAEKQLASRGLTAYTRRPLLTTVEIDRTYYEPLSVPVLRRFAEQVPPSFRFVVKAHEDCIVRRFPLHARYARKRGQENPLYLDPVYATDAVIAPLCEALGEKLGVLLFQFPPQDVGGAASFARELSVFLQRLPPGIVYAVELRNRDLFSAAYMDALAGAGAVHCHNVWGEMPSVLTQARRVPPFARNPLVVRWLMRRGVDYRTAGARYTPFNRIVEEDLTNRGEIAHLIARATEHGVSTFALLDNKAEGCAPESVVRLARAIVEACERRRSPDPRGGDPRSRNTRET